ncbi:hypothetical protein CEUSTIGMA_g11122.t1 [Chlamydomonas eustigma]|uniref:DUF676 domain-containing protein n=1 Tax=Chlamydomonas eustigma TaxID=1157962 RepID=A0A250XKV6_9CHLO|nr:hypothetical protein CEUSTIGMA_g11122.t1 [Chlamydomonas eustigma]|eukprot:GAX83697.1 hypothetical protein CEUSTIGMA_g11122.t1 [Chlamydomonas eustigma]
MSGPSTHLVVLQHGLWGKPENLDYLQENLVRNSKEMSHLSTHFLISTVNFGLTLDGIDMCGERLVDQIKEEIQILEKDPECKVTYLSLVGYSLGGLITRYATGKLEFEGAFAPGGLIPLNFVTISTPHLGVFKTKSGFFRKAFNSFVPKMASWSGHQLMYMDHHAWGRPLLVNMSDPQLPFMKGLKKFSKLILLANVHFDSSVPYWSGAISLEDPYLKHQSYFGRSKSMPAAEDALAYPSIRRPCTDEEAAGYDEEERDRIAMMGGGFRTAVLFLFLIWVPLLSYGLVRWSAKGKSHYKSLIGKRPDFTWLLNDPATALTPIHLPLHVKTAETSPRPSSTRSSSRESSQDDLVKSGLCGGSAKGGILEKQQWMEKHLNELPWLKIDVDCRYFHSHAGIVVRAPGFVVRDQIQYMTEHMSWK